LTKEWTYDSLSLWSDCGQFVAIRNGTWPGVGDSGGTPSSEGVQEIHKMKNSGNEAKKYLKTKENDFFSAANCARFARKFA
jgi:hypothetical protein